MKTRKVSCALLGLLLIPFLYGQNGCSVSPTTTQLFEQAWYDFDLHYSYFTYKQIDWNAVKKQYAPNFVQELDPEEFAVQLNNMLQVLHDWHVWVASPQGNIYGYNGTYNTNRPAWSITSQYVTGAASLANGAITHGTVNDNIAYIDVATLDATVFAEISDDDIEQIFQTHAASRGMIIDIRSNNGGDENNAMRICSHLTDETFTYGYTRTRNGPSHNSFDGPVQHTLEPGTGTRFAGPVVCLIGQRCMSSAEWFALMVKRAPNGTLIGETTRGASGFPQTYSLANNVSYAISSWMAYTYDNEEIEDNGIAPDIAVPYEESFDDSHDYVLERAIAFIENGESEPTTTVPGDDATTTVPDDNTTTTMPGGATTTSSIPGSSTTSSALPVAEPSLTVEPTSGTAGFPAGTQFVFTATAGKFAGKVWQYWWDFDGNGAEFNWNNGLGIDEISNGDENSRFWQYYQAGTYTAFVIILDKFGHSEVASTTVTVTQP